MEGDAEAGDHIGKRNGAQQVEDRPQTQQWHETSADTEQHRAVFRSTAEKLPEQDAVKRSAAEREAYRLFFDRQRGRAMKRQKRVNQYGWLLLIVTIGSFIWLYVDTVNKAAASNRVAFLQTLVRKKAKKWFSR